jgi:hypothetical protein
VRKMESVKIEELKDIFNFYNDKLLEILLEMEEEKYGR